MRADLHMSPGKLAAQAGHAFVETLRLAPSDLCNAYHSDGIGTKVVLYAPNATELNTLHKVALRLEIPTALIIDDGHVMLPHFDGSRVLTSVGFGPVTRKEADVWLKRFKLVE